LQEWFYPLILQSLKGKDHIFGQKTQKIIQRNGRVVYCTGLENRRPFTGSGGSNPSSSAIEKRNGPDLIGAFLLARVEPNVSFE
jgi:hypothetical protein